MRRFSLFLLVVWMSAEPAVGQERSRPYRLNAVDLKQAVIWDAECLQPEGQGLAFGGQDQDAADGRPHTRLWIDGRWQAIHDELRRSNSMQPLYHSAWSLRQDAKRLLARVRHLYFEGLPSAQTSRQLVEDIRPAVAQFRSQLVEFESSLRAFPSEDAYVRGQLQFAREHVARAGNRLPRFEGELSAEELKDLHRAQIQLELASEALDAEPPARAMHCGTARVSESEVAEPASALVFDRRTGLYVLFGGDHLDYLTNDTWVFDPAERRWFQRHPVHGAPPPRANHRLEARGDGTVRLVGGYTYSSETGYISGQYLDLRDGPWIYDLVRNEWRGESESDGSAALVPADSRVYRTGPFHPDYFLQGARPDAAEFQRWLEQIPTNTWVATDPPHLPRLNRDWGTARIDPKRDLLLRWSGGHSAHGGSDVLHYHFATNRWELPFPVEFPLGQLYSNTSYPNGFNFNLRPWVTGHTYQNYDYDPPSGTLIKAGRPRHFYVYDPDLGDWIGRGPKPPAMQYNSCFYTLTLAATPHGVMCWDRNGRLHRYDHESAAWHEIELEGDTLTGAYVDNSTLAYDSRRDRLLAIATAGDGKPFEGDIWSIDLRTRTVERLKPDGHEHAVRFANVDKCCYDAEHDLLLLGTFLKDPDLQGAPAHTATPAYDCAANRWVTLDLQYTTGERNGNPTRAFPHRRSAGLVYDPARRLIWGTVQNSEVYVLRLDLDRAQVRSLGEVGP